MTTTNRKGMTETEIATAMGVKKFATAASRLTALGYTVECSRCGGTGRYSYNQIDGDRCYGCSGRRRMLAKITPAIVAEALARIEAGELAGYFAEHDAARKIDAASKAMWSLYMGSPISKAYSEASGWRAIEAIGGHEAFESSPACRAQTLQNKVLDVGTRATQRSDKRPTTERLADIKFATRAIAALNAAWRAMVARA